MYSIEIIFPIKTAGCGTRDQSQRGSPKSASKTMAKMIVIGHFLTYPNQPLVVDQV